MTTAIEKVNKANRDAASINKLTCCALMNVHAIDVLKAFVERLSDVEQVNQYNINAIKFNLDEFIKTIE